MEIWIKAGQLLLSLSLLIVLHELGHFIPAKIFKTRVEKFYLFFDAWFSLWKTKKGDTEYGIGWLPLGGYVKISGMIDESMDTEQMKEEPQPWEFRSKPVWQRLIIMLGGVTVNVIVAVIIYVMVMAVWGKDQLRPNDMLYGYDVPEIVEEYGFQDGDIVLEVDGEALKHVEDINRLVLFDNAETFKVKHPNGEVETITLPEDIDYEFFKTESSFSPRVHAIIDTVMPKSPAALSGMQKGDKVVEIEGESVVFWNELVSKVSATYDATQTDAQKYITADEKKNVYWKFLQFRKDYKKDLAVMVERNGEQKELIVPINAKGALGVSINGDMSKHFHITHVDYSFLEAIPAGWSEGVSSLGFYAGQMKYLFTNKGAKSVGGFGTFGSLFPPKWEWKAFWKITAFISIILAFMNILPIPALDGGHVMFLLYEAVAGRPPNQKFMEYAQITGFVILLALVIYANANDIIRAAG